MYQFNYQGLLPPDELFITCIVPTAWLTKNLPTMGGCVSYADGREQLTSCASMAFEFSDDGSTADSSRTIYLDIQSDGKRCFDKPVTIHCQNIKDSDVDNDWCIEVVLLNHLFGCNALSASMGNIYLDYADLIAVMQKSLDFDFKFGVGEIPSDILPGILGHDAKSAFWMIFCNEKKMRMTYYKETMKAMHASYSEDALILLSDVAVDQEKMLISALVGR